jgi:hypothetical protein
MGALPIVHALKHWKGEPIADRIMRPVGGLEAEFALLVDGVPAKPEVLFGDPRGFITEPLMHRTGRSFQLPNGGAVYFDTGVIEVATPVMELEQGCFGRLARSLHDAVLFVRHHLDGWEHRTGRRIQLQGFSTHYNVSVGGPGTIAPSRRVQDLAWLLIHILPAPVMLLATNRRSTGVGVRPRPRRIEITADYPPDPTRLAATGALIAGVVQATNRWRDLRVASLRRRGIPVLDGFSPVKHTSRKGWLARIECYPANPFECDVNQDMWSTDQGPLTLRGLAQKVLGVFDQPVRRIADPFSYECAKRILSGKSRSWLDDAERPASYDDVGRASRSPAPLKRLGLSRYEEVVLKTMRRKPLTLGRERFTPVGMRGWSRVVFTRDRDGARTVLPLDTLVHHLDDWAA